jgi:Ca2+-binding RTX toxin-like protein
VSYALSRTAVRASAGGQAGSPKGGGLENDALSGIENLTGSRYSDLLGGGSDANVISGGGGADAISGAGGDDELSGGAGDDDLTGSDGADTLNGGSGIDTASYRDSNGGVTISLLGKTSSGAHASRDILIAIENLAGSIWEDDLSGNGAANVITGGRGRDTLCGAAGDDVLLGGAGRDNLNGGSGADRLDGGGGPGNTASYESSDAAVTVSLQTGRGAGGHAEGDELEGIANLVGSAHSDKLTGGAQDNVMRGLAGIDVLSGSDGRDALDGGDGDDLLIGGLGSDALHGGAGTDTISYTDALRSAGIFLFRNEVSESDAYTDTLSSIENAIGSAFGDGIYGNQSNNSLSGGAGDDELHGAGGADHLAGGAGSDTLFGDEGAETFVFLDNGGRDRVLGFEDGVEQFDLTAVAQVNSFEDLKVLNASDGVVVHYGTGSFFVQSATLESIGGTDFLF